MVTNLETATIAGLNAACDSLNYQLERANVATAKAEYSCASRGIELAKIRERLAELKCQHEPLAGLIEKQMTERERLYAAAFYVVIGRFPS